MNRLAGAKTGYLTENVVRCPRPLLEPDKHPFETVGVHAVGGWAQCRRVIGDLSDQHLQNGPNGGGVSLGGGGDSLHEALTHAVIVPVADVGAGPLSTM